MDKKVKEILATLYKNGFEVSVVGGAVRDILSHKDVSDWDITTNAKPREIQGLFKNSFYNNTFGTVAIPIGSDHPVEVTTYRMETGYSDMRHPDEVKWGESLAEDLARRDFTINAMGLPFVKGKLSSIPADPYGGQEDLKKKVVRAVGDPNKRFSEDALRILRAIRFATTLGFKIEAKTLAAVAKAAKLLAKISGERTRDELFKIIDSENAADGIMSAKDTGVLKEILPELDSCFSVEQKSPQRHHIYDVGTHCVMSLKFCPSQDTIVRFATLLHDVGKPKVASVTEEGVRTFYNHEVVGGRIAKDIAGRLHLSREAREKLFKLVRFHQFSVNENQTDRALRRFITNIGVECVDDMMDLRIGDRLGGGLQQPESWRLKLFRQRLKEVLKRPFGVKDLKVSGNDVMEVLGLKPGPKVGTVLNALFEEVVDDPKKNTREYLLKEIKKTKP